MKKSLISLLALVLSCVMLFAACGNKADDKKDDDKEEETTVAATTDANGESVTPSEGTPVVPSTPAPSVPAEKTDAEKVADYVAANESMLITAFETGFTSSGLTCSTTAKAEGTGIILTINVNELDNLAAEQKTVMQTTFDQMAPSLSANLAEIQKEIPELDYIKVNVCEKDGDHVATINVGGANTDAPVTPAPSAPVSGTAGENVGVKTYSMGSEADGEMVVVSFVYDAQGNVTKLLYGMIADTSISTSDGIASSFEAVKTSLDSLKAYGCNVTVDYTVEGTLYTLESEVAIDNEIGATFLGGMFGVANNGAIVKLADVEAAAIAEGFTLYTE